MDVGLALMLIGMIFLAFSTKVYLLNFFPAAISLYLGFTKADDNLFLSIVFIGLALILLYLTFWRASEERGP